MAYVPGEGELATEQQETGAGSLREQKAPQKCGHSVLKLYHKTKAQAASVYLAPYLRGKMKNFSKPPSRFAGWKSYVCRLNWRAWRDQANFL